MAENANQSPSLGLYGKMAKIMGEMEHIPKNGTNSFFGYKFASEGDISDAVRNKLSAYNIALFSSMTKWSQSQFTTAKGKTSNKTICEFEFTLVCADSGTSRTSTWCAEADDEQDKGFNKAATAAMKYWLLKTFMIPTGDDPDADNDKQEKGKGKVEKWPTTELIGGIIKGAIDKLNITADDVKRYTGIANLEDVEAWNKYASRNDAAKAIKEAYDKHMAELAASKPATPKTPPPYTETDLHKAVLTTVYAGNEHHMKRSIAKMLTDGELTTGMTLEQAVKVIEAHKAAKLAEEAAKITAAEAKKKLDSGGEKRLGDTPTLDPEPSRLAELNNEELMITRIEPRADSRGWYGIGKFDGMEVRVNIFAPEDPKMLEDANHTWTGKTGAVAYPVVLKEDRGMLRIASVKPKRGKSPFGKPTDEGQEAFDALSSANALPTP